MLDDLSKSKAGNHSISKDDTEFGLKQSSVSFSYLENKKNIEKNLGCSLVYEMEEPGNCADGNPYEQEKKADKKLWKCLYEQESIHFKVKKLKISHELFEFVPGSNDWGRE